MDILALALSGQSVKGARGREERAACAVAISKGLLRIEPGRPELVLGYDRQVEQHFGALPSSTIPSDGHVRFRMVAAQTIATMLRSAGIAAKRHPVDHGNRLFHGFQ
jgi:hypothetical protein